jgi:hypothetical protein
MDRDRERADNHKGSLVPRCRIELSGMGLTTDAPHSIQRVNTDTEYIMKRKLSAMSQRYLPALKRHLKQGGRGSVQPALALGHQAVAFDLETLDMARIHERALVALQLASGKSRAIKRAEMFFNQSIAPIVETHRAAQHTRARLNRLQEALDERTL